MSRRTKVHLIELVVVDHDDMGVDQVMDVLRHTRYPNHCINPEVRSSKTEEVDWSDDHPLNRMTTFAAAVDELFREEKEGP